VTNNLLEGIIHEISYAATIVNNTLAGNGQGRGTGNGPLWGTQIMVFNSVNVEIASNTLLVPNGADGIGLLDGTRQDFGVNHYLQNVKVTTMTSR